MDITKFLAFFHDGGIINIQQIKDTIEISMETSQILPEWNEDNIPLSDFQNDAIINMIYTKFKIAAGAATLLVAQSLSSGSKALSCSSGISNTSLVLRQSAPLFCTNHLK